MRYRALMLFCLATALASATIIDRIAIVVNNGIIKDSDIDRDIRVTGFLNSGKMDLSLASRKEAANHLIEQIFIRREISLGGYGAATPEEASQQLQQLESQRYRSQVAFNQALQRYDINELEMREHFQWQLTVLRFIDLRFKPAVLVTDEQIQTYHREHAADLRKQFPGKTLDELRPQIEDNLRGEQVNQLFFAWLDQQRKDSKIKYLEESLR